MLWPGLFQEQQVTFRDLLVIWGGLGRAGNGDWHYGTKTLTELLKRDIVNILSKLNHYFNLFNILITSKNSTGTDPGVHL